MTWQFWASQFSQKRNYRTVSLTAAKDILYATQCHKIVRLQLRLCSLYQNENRPCASAIKCIATALCFARSRVFSWLSPPATRLWSPTQSETQRPKYRRRLSSGKFARREVRENIDDGSRPTRYDENSTLKQGSVCIFYEYYPYLISSPTTRRKKYHRDKLACTYLLCSEWVCKIQQPNLYDPNLNTISKVLDNVYPKVITHLLSCIS